MIVVLLSGFIASRNDNSGQSLLSRGRDRLTIWCSPEPPFRCRAVRAPRAHSSAPLPFPEIMRCPVPPGPEQQVSAQNIEETRRQIQRLFEEVARLSELDLLPADY